MITDEVGPAPISLLHVLETDMDHTSLSLEDQNRSGI
jgi:hypothetical protein